MEPLILNGGDIILLDASVVLEDFVIVHSQNDIELNNINDYNGLTNLSHLETANCDLENIAAGDLPISETVNCAFIGITTAGEELLKDNSNIIPEELVPEKTRKRKTNQNKWKRNIRRKQCQSGESYVSARGKPVLAKKIQYNIDCKGHCRFKCKTKITQSEREELFKSFYSLDQHGKTDFILRSTIRTETHRKTKKDADSRRMFSFSYYVELLGNRVQICKSFWLATFAISQKPVYNAHNKKHLITGIAKKK